MRATRTSTKKDESKVERGPVLEVLQKLLEEQRNGEVVELVTKLVAANGDLERRLAEILARKNKSERIAQAQLRLVFEELGQAEQAAAESPDGALDAANDTLTGASGVPSGTEEEKTNRPPKQPRMRTPAPPALRRVENPIRVPDAQRACPVCGTERECIGHDETEVLELIPAEVVVRVDRREKLKCEKCEGEIVRAPVGDKVVSGGRLGSMLVAALLVDKYQDGLALHRQKQRFGRLGLDLAVSTLADQVTWATDLLRPLWRIAIEWVLAAKVMHLDSTSLPVLDRDAPSGKRVGTLWGYVGDVQAALYLYATTGKKKAQRAGELGPEEMLSRRIGYVVADASNLYDASFKRRPELIECGCNMHGRRYFVKALEAGDKRAVRPLIAYQKIYEIEDRIRYFGPDAKLAARRAEIKPVFDALVGWCQTYKKHEPPTSPLGDAVRYFTNHQVPLGRFLEDGVIPPDNGVVERLHVRTALTRKNYLFAGSDAGGERAAIAYTILACCRLADVNPVEYLSLVLPRLARGVRLVDLPALMPERWKASRPPRPEEPDAEPAS
jgi:transposase